MLLAHLVSPQDVRKRRRFVVLHFQIRNHARGEQERHTNEHLHTESQEEHPVCVVFHARSGKTADDVEDDEQNATVSGVVCSLEDFWVAERRDLGVLVSMSSMCFCYNVTREDNLPVRR